MKKHKQISAFPRLYQAFPGNALELNMDDTSVIYNLYLALDLALRTRQ